MKRLLSYMKAYRKESLLGPLFKMLEASFELLVPLVVASMVDVGIRGRDVSYVLRMGGILVLLGIIGLACSLTAQYFAARAATGAATAMRNNLFSHIAGLPAAAVSLCGIWSHDHGFYGRCKSRYGLCSDDTGAVCDRIWHYAGQYAFISIRPKTAGSGSSYYERKSHGRPGDSGF